MDRRDRIDRQNWFYAIDLGGGVVSPGRFGHNVTIRQRLRPGIDLLRRPAQ
jgi:hypothetical protein